MTKIIQTKDYILWVSEQFPEIGDWFYIPFTNTVEQFKNIDYGEFHPHKMFYEKVSGHLPLHNAPKLEGVLFLPEFGTWIKAENKVPSTNLITKVKIKELGELTFNAEFDTVTKKFKVTNKEVTLNYGQGSYHKLQWLELPKQEDDVEQFMYNAIQAARGNSFETFYKKAAKNCAEVYKANTGKYDIESINWRDVESAFRKYRQSLDGVETISAYTYWLQHKLPEYLQSLSPATLPVDFEPKYNISYITEGGGNELKSIPYKRLKTIQTEEGETIVGKWIFK